MLIVTNNPMVAEASLSKSTVFLECDYDQVLLAVKQRIIEQQMVLLTHPLSGSIKPNETYYKSIVLEEGSGQGIDLPSLEYMEEAFVVYEKFIKNKQRPNWTVAVLKDFAYVDYYLMESTFERMLIR